MSSNDLEAAGISFEPKVLTFGLGPNDRSPVDQELHDVITLTNHGSSRKFTFLVPAENEKLSCRLYPGAGVIKAGQSVTVHVYVTLHMTTSVKRKIKLEAEGLGIRLFTIELVGELSHRLDPDDIVTKLPPIGRGSFGTVYRATYRGQEVAAKILNSQEDPREMEEFQKEVDLMMRLRCPYVLHFIGASVVSYKACLVTELCVNGSVADVIFSTRKLKYLTTLKFALDMAKALDFLHTNGVLHRDIKPDNFLVISFSAKAPVSCKIADFGTSRSMTQTREEYNHTAALGTPIYMAPEIYERVPYSAKVDVYSFGIMLWVLYTRKEPYADIPRVWDIPPHVMAGGRPAIPSRCPGALGELMDKCWTHVPSERPDMYDVVHTLDALFEAEGTHKPHKKQFSRVPNRAGAAQTARPYDKDIDDQERDGGRHN
jgi:tRNA A-37 threonylcarbamoyl transferase component Bud32